MNGLLGSEFALVLRDSLNSTPRRHIVSPSPPAPTSQPPMLSPAKKPRVAEFALPCDMKLEPRLHLSAIPTSPTSPLPTATATRLGLVDSANPAILPVSPSSAIAKPRRRPDSAVIGVRRQLCSALADSAPLEFLATVSASQDVVRGIGGTEIGVRAMPMSPVNSEGGGGVGASPEPRKRGKVAKKTGGSGRVFSCKQCASTFSQQFNLNKHVRAVHERRRPFECQTCHARFQQKSHRTMHHLAVHEKLRQFGCDQCNASFSWRGVLKKHRKSIHGMDD